MSPTSKRKWVTALLLGWAVAVAGALMAGGQFFRMSQFGGTRAYFDQDTIATGQIMAKASKDPSTGSSLTGASLYSAYRVVNFPLSCQQFGPSQMLTSSDPKGLGPAGPIDTQLLLQTANVDINTKAFQTNTDQFVTFSAKMPDYLASSGNCTLTVYWLESTGANAQTVKWVLKQAHAAGGANIDGTPINATATSTTNNTTYTVHKDSIVQSLTTLGWAAGDIVEVRMGRNGFNGADTYTGSALVLQTALELPIDPMKGLE